MQTNEDAFGGSDMNAIDQHAVRIAADTERDPRWAAVRARDAGANGRFWYSVATTGVYCRPSCASRLARPENVRFHATREDAERAGFRPCKRCKPDQPRLTERHAAVIADACRLIPGTQQVPGLDDPAPRGADA